MEHGFTVAETYRRRDIHRQYGGQRQGGISTPAKTLFVFIFSGETGEEYGYRDHWTPGTYLYTREGRVGNMRFFAEEATHW